MIHSFKEKKIIQMAESILNEFDLCDACTGRFFAKIESGIDNTTRGKKIRKSLGIKNSIDIEKCWLCNGLFKEIDHFVELIKYNLEEFEYNTFLIGSIVDDEIIEKEKIILDKFDNEYSESAKNELNREIGKRLEKSLSRTVDFLNPEIMVLVDTAYDTIYLQIKSLYIYGKYKKFKRTIPQTKWFCNICRGKGCKRCNYSGKLYDSSVEELISKIIIRASKSESSLFHGCGREDIDVKMLGNGRPFVLELRNPVKRTLNFQKITNEINKDCKGKIEVSHLRYSNKDEVSRLKSAGFQKTYRVRFKGEKTINNEKLIKASLSLQGRDINQFTPLRVAHRRANMVREKHIYKCQIESLDGAIATLIITAESGTYIKELITGDEGRTVPNLSEMIDNPCEIIELDVIEIKGE